MADLARKSMGTAMFLVRAKTLSWLMGRNPKEPLQDQQGKTSPMTLSRIQEWKAYGFLNGPCYNSAGDRFEQSLSTIGKLTGTAMFLVATAKKH
jgi:hypothetical protein